MSKIAVVLCNLGGPDSLDAVKPFLLNLFADRAILRIPQPFRWMLGSWIVHKRLAFAKDNYSLIGGCSPLLKQTRDQAEALEERLISRNPKDNYKTFVAMRYWHPMAPEVVADVLAWGPDRVVILPLYPQFSTTTSESSISDWMAQAKRKGLTCPHVAVCCYPTHPGWIHGVTQSIETALAQISGQEPPRIVFSAHGLPKSIVDAGDPYQTHVEATVEAVVQSLHIEGLDWIIAYQSRVGPQTWIGPATEDVIAAAGAEKKALIIVPIAFVSEHSETLVELDIDYKKQADDAGVPAYIRTPTVGCNPHFIGGLADLVESSLCEAGPDLVWYRFGKGCNQACQNGGYCSTNPLIKS